MTKPPRSSLKVRPAALNDPALASARASRRAAIASASTPRSNRDKGNLLTTRFGDGHAFQDQRRRPKAFVFLVADRPRGRERIIDERCQGQVVSVMRVGAARASSRA